MTSHPSAVGSDPDAGRRPGAAATAEIRGRRPTGLRPDGEASLLPRGPEAPSRAHLPTAIDPLLAQLKETFRGRYEVLKQIGRGGMGSVFMASQPTTSRLFALKVLHGVVTEKDYLRFDREMALVSRLDHPNVVRVVDHGRAPDGTAFLAMELVPGESLHSLLGRHGRLSLERSLRIAFHVASGLGAVHASGIVHRDVKPENVMVTDHFGHPDFAILLDFGIAREFSSFRPGSVPLTSKGVFLGTPRYAAPEAIVGEPLTTRSDVYSLGCLVYQLLAGRCPFEDASPLTVMDMHLKRRAVPMLHASAVPIRVELASLVDAMLEKRPEHRPESMAEVTTRLLAELNHLQGGGAGPFGRPSPVVRAMRTPDLDAMLAAPPDLPSVVVNMEAEPEAVPGDRPNPEGVVAPPGPREPANSPARGRPPARSLPSPFVIALGALAIAGWALFLSAI